MQILAIVLYSHHGERRELPLRLGQLNIITGSSKTGKSALVEIVNYCFGAGRCEVPEGPIRRAVSWFGLRLRVSDGEVFIARRCPTGAAHSSEDCFVVIGKEVPSPDSAELHQTVNTDGLIELLNTWCGIRENLHEPAPGQTRLPLAANVRHALLLCFQPQDVIGRKSQLFCGADNTWVGNSIRDTLPYFLGAVDDDHIQLLAELKLVREQLRSVNRQLLELQSLQGQGTSRAVSLLSLAREVGLTEEVADTWEQAAAVLQRVAKVPLASVEAVTADERAGAEVSRLAEERRELMALHLRLREEIESVTKVESEELGYSTEALEQRARLRAVGIFEGRESDSVCPLCTQSLNFEGRPPSTEDITGDLQRITQRLEGVASVAPQVQSALVDLNEKLQEVRSKLAANRASLEALRQADDQVRTAIDDSAKRAHVLGRISLFVESLPQVQDSKELEAMAASLRAKCASIEALVSDELVQERLSSILARLSGRMTKWASQLHLEHSEASLRLDIKRLTVVADTDDGAVPMSRMGSAANWVGYHLITHLALHEWFVKRNRPVPRFLFLDQPSQVYFPPEQDEDGLLNSGREEDRTAVIEMFRLVQDVVNHVAPGLQVVITEHADLTEAWYQDAVVHRWRSGAKLVPENWPRFTS